MQNKTLSPQRPVRMRDSLGRTQSLNAGAQAFDFWLLGPANTSLLVLGLGPHSASEAPYSADISDRYKEILWLECPQFSAGLTGLTGFGKPRPALPPHWRQVEIQEALQNIDRCDIRLYRQNSRLFPEFWGPLWGEVQRQRLGLPQRLVESGAEAGAEFGAGQHGQKASVMLPSSEQSLLHRELTQAFTEAGFAVAQPPVAGDTSPRLHEWKAFLREQRPALVFSVNGQGLDAEGEIFHLLQACQVPVALWFVDNPWHILTRLRLPWWRKAQLFCTDAAFVEDLRRAGAARVAHLPLAVAGHMWQAQAYPSPQSAEIPGGALEQVLFVGRLAFPQRQAFFGASRVPESLLHEAFALLEQDDAPLPHFQWWARRLGLDPQSLWPGNQVRAAGLGAEECALRKRLLWLHAASACGLSHYGHLPADTAALHETAGFQSSLSSVQSKGQNKALSEARPPVDYYTTLPRLYASAPYTLNVTSLLLPQGLTQRHFDVWAAGGFLLTDNTSGLDIFPPHLTAEIRLDSPQALAPRLRRLDAEPLLRRQVQEAWKQHLREQHSYTQRIRSICEQMGMAP